MKRNLNRGVTISKCFCRALYSDLSEMIGVCGEGYVHLVPNASDLPYIAMRMHGETGERFEIISFSGRMVLVVPSWSECTFVSERAGISS